jgi:hypothetical protein
MTFDQADFECRLRHQPRWARESSRLYEDERLLRAAATRLVKVLSSSHRDRRVYMLVRAADLPESISQYLIQRNQ